MPRFPLALAAFLCLLVAPATSTSADAGTADLSARLTKSLHSPHVSLGRTGAIAVDAATGEVLFAHNATRPLVPASNEKLPVAWTALILLGPGYRFHTDVLGLGVLMLLLVTMWSNQDQITLKWSELEDLVEAANPERADSEDAKKAYPDGWKAPKPYIRIVPQPKA